ncbi:MAG: putative DNA binding domain-containing protein [Acidobacteriota bacterium]|jgi:ATP-dependent DNA helicase RecG|nr:putative DNA binding domain-containing protein [Acidobacteriota bacterium]
MPEHQNTEWKREWDDAFLKHVCGFANANGGTLFIGIDDSGKVFGLKSAGKLLEDIPNKIKQKLGIVVDVNLHEKDGLPYLEIIVAPQPVPISCDGALYYRSGSTNQMLTGASLESFLLGKRGLHWDESPYPRIELPEFDQGILNRFVDRAIKKGRLREDVREMPAIELLEKLRLIRAGFFTYSSLLLFTKDPEKWFTGAFIKIGFFEGPEVIYHDEIHGSILEQADLAIELIYTKYLKAKISYEGIERVERHPFPVEAVREAILNAIVHKDYARGVPVQIRVYDDKMRLSNTGRLPAGWAVEKLLGSHPSTPYNPSIANVFYLAGHIETWGRGIEKIMTACRDDGIYPPQYDVSSTDITVEFTAPEARLIRTNGRIEGSNDFALTDKNALQIGDSLYSAHNERCFSDVLSGVLSDVAIRNLTQILAVLDKNGFITPKAAQAAIGKSAATARRYLSLLCEKGIIVAQGNTNKIRYVLKNEVYGKNRFR